jgi:ABC-type nitrate/sulfonate/bicarbonate transport system ATPase subunit
MCTHPIEVNDPPALEVVDLSATFIEQRRRLQVLRDVSLSVRRNEFVSIVGPSGSGKTTLLDIVSGLLSPDTGTVFLDGGATTAADRLGRAAYMHQRDLLLPWRTALDNAALALEVQGMARPRGSSFRRLGCRASRIDIRPSFRGGCGSGWHFCARC